MGISDSGTPEPSHQPDSSSVNEESEDGGADPDDPCAQEAPAAKRQRPPDPPPVTPPATPRMRGQGESLAALSGQRREQEACTNGLLFCSGLFCPPFDLRGGPPGVFCELNTAGWGGLLVSLGVQTGQYPV